jgi:hypothetical protein
MNNIATHSIEEGLDFGLNLMMGPAADAGRDDAVLAQKLLRLIEQFIHPRYAGEPEIALDALEWLADCVPLKYQRNREQIEAQIAWLREQLPEDIA